MAEIRLIRGMGSIKKVRSCTHGPGGKPGPGTGRCSCKVEARWRDAAGEDQREVFDTYKAALNHLNDVYQKKRYATGKTDKPRGTIQLLEPYAKNWLDKMTELAPTSAKLYKSELDLHTYPYMGMLPVKKISEERLKEHIVMLQDRNVYPGTIRQLVTNVLRPIFNQAIKEGLITENPCDELKLPKVPKADRYVPTMEETHAIALAIKPRWRLAIYLMVGCGLRQGEMLAVDTTTRISPGRIYLRRQRLQKGGFGNLKHDHEEIGRGIPMDPFVEAEWDRHIEEFGIEEGGLLFPSKDGATTLSPSTFSYDLIKALKELGWEDKKIKVHNFRHAFASLSIAAGVELPEVARMLGHKDVKITYKLYYHFPRNWSVITRKISSFMSSSIPEGSGLPDVLDQDEKQEQIDAHLKALADLGVVLDLAA